MIRTIQIAGFEFQVKSLTCTRDSLKKLREVEPLLNSKLDSVDDLEKAVQFVEDRLRAAGNSEEVVEDALDHIGAMDVGEMTRVIAVCVGVQLKPKQDVPVA